MSPVIYSILLGLILFLPVYGCAPVVFREIRKEIDRDITFERVSPDPDTFVGGKVLWGGEIVSSRNEEHQAVIEVIQTPLDYIDKPGDRDLSRGRFLIVKEGFLDPAIYAEGRKITVAGAITGKRREAIGEGDYVYPVVRALKMHLWKKETVPLYPPVIYDPFYYSPYYPYYFDPWPYPGRFPYPYFWHPPHGIYPYWHPPEVHD